MFDKIRSVGRPIPGKPCGAYSLDRHGNKQFCTINTCSHHGPHSTDSRNEAEYKRRLEAYNHMHLEEYKERLGRK